MSSIPKVITLQNTTFKDRRSLFWLTDFSGPRKHHEGIVTSLADYARYKEQIPVVGIIALSVEGEEDVFFDKLHEVSKCVTLVLLSEAILSRKTPGYWEDNFDNILTLDDLHAQYPFIGEQWDKTAEDAVAISASLLRYQYIYGIGPSTLSSTRREVLATHGISVSMEGPPATPAVLVTQFYKPDSGRRFRELKEVLARNCACPWIDRIVLLNERDYSAEWKDISGNEKIEQIIIGERLMYSHFLQYVSEHCSRNTHVILANADIYFEAELREIWKVDMRDKMFALLRWDIVMDANGNRKAELFGPRNDSQDSWIFFSDSIKDRKWNFETFEYTLGTLGCDNKFMTDMVRMKFAISNPARSIKSYHLHLSNSRTYDKHTRLTPDVFILMEPSVLLDTHHIVNIGRKPLGVLENGTVEFEVKSSTPSNAIAYCTLLEKDGRFKWEAGAEQEYSDKVPIYEWKNASVTTNGLVYDMWNIYKGGSKVADSFWKEANIHLFTPMQKRSTMIAIPFRDTSCFKNFDTYCSEYLSRVLRIIRDFAIQGPVSFWIPPEYEGLLGQFEFDCYSIDGAKYDGETAVYADRVLGSLPESRELGKEDIIALRQVCPYWEKFPIEGEKKKCVILMDDRIFTHEICKELCSVFGDNWIVSTVRPGATGVLDEILGASACIFFGGHGKSSIWSKLWSLPEGCTVLEFQEEGVVDGEFQHFAHVAGYKSWVYLLKGLNAEPNIVATMKNHISKWLMKL